MIYSDSGPNKLIYPIFKQYPTAAITLGWLNSVAFIYERVD